MEHYHIRTQETMYECKDEETVLKKKQISVNDKDQGVSVQKLQ